MRQLDDSLSVTTDDKIESYPMLMLVPTIVFKLK